MILWAWMRVFVVVFVLVWLCVVFVRVCIAVVCVYTRVFVCAFVCLFDHVCLYPPQGDMESRMGFVITAATDRGKLGSGAKSQAGFLEFVCLPLFNAWHAFSHDHALLARVADNVRMWKDMAAAGVFPSSCLPA